MNTLSMTRPTLTEIAPGELSLDFPISQLDPRIQRYFEQIEQKIQANTKQELVRFYTIYTYFSMSIRFNPFHISNEVALYIIEEIISSHPFDQSQMTPSPDRLMRIPVEYGGNVGPDLPFVANITGLSEEEVIRLHSSVHYFVYFLGFLPGFPYLGGLDERLFVPRRREPRKYVPMGAVAIGGEQTGIYPQDSPGGWHIIGKTSVPMMKETSALVQAGDWIQFVPK